MKKILCLILAAFLAVPLMACADATDRRGLIEFVELYTQRLTEYQLENAAELPLITDAFSRPFLKNGLLILDSSAGSIAIHTDNFSVHDVLITFASSADSASDREKSVTCAAIAVSALEYDAVADRIMKLKQKGAVDTALDTVGNGFTEILEKYLKKSSWDTRVKVASGNYDYYFDSLTEQDVTIVYLIAEEHE